MKNLYHSTRNKEKYLHDYEAILQGIADDGGLYILDALGEEKVSIQKMIEYSYEEVAICVMERLLPSFTKEEIADCIDGAYTHTFDNEDITPINMVGNNAFLELFHGPTSAFKDVGLQMLPQLMSKALKRKDNHKVMILTATSGDTGKAALEGFKDVKNTAIQVFYPNQGVSEIQRLQMVTQQGSNVAVCALHGNFDDAQSQVKKMFNTKELQAAFQEDNITFSSANSINIGRLIPQVVYYFYAYIQMVRKQEIQIGEEVCFVVPTGNFGNVLAGYYAKLLGLPVHRFIVASNANNVLFDFLQSGVYDRKRKFHKTISPSMDILISSNLERLLYYMSDKNCNEVKEYMKELDQKGSYIVKPALKEHIQRLFYGSCCSDAQCEMMIKEVYETYGYVMDPHTAVGFKAMKDYQKVDQEHRCILLSTASPFKFSQQVYKAIFGKHLDLDEFAVMEVLARHSDTRIPENLYGLKDANIRFKDCIEKEQMQEYIRKTTKEIFYD